MKKALIFLSAAGMLAFFACGPSAEEQAAKEKARQDSIHMADSIKAAEEAAVELEKARQDSIAKAQEMEKMRQDSIARAAEAKSSAKPAKKGPPVPKTVTAPGGRPGATKDN